MELFTIEHLSFAYPEQEKQVLRDVSLTLRSGDFVVMAGLSGCGKSTLLRQMKTVLAPHGCRTGSVRYRGQELAEVAPEVQAAKIGFVLQDPDAQIVTDKVWHELAFGLESLGFDTPTIRGRVAEMASFFGIQTWFHMEVTQLSGGQKQLLNLAAIMAMQPDVLILDEPTSQLDPIAAVDFLQTLGRINRELGTTIVITEHRLEEVLPLAGRMVILDEGQILTDDTPENAFALLRRLEHRMLASMPAPMWIWSALEQEETCPLTVSDGREFLSRFAGAHTLKPLPPREKKVLSGEPAARLEEAWFRYERNGSDVLKGVSLEAWPGELLCILGGNGTGKSTTLSILSGTNRPYRGKVHSSGIIAALPQNPQMILVSKNVREDLLAVFSGKRTEEQDRAAARVVALCRLEGLLDRHPYDLSGGEQQRAALAKVLLQEPDILLLDEPTKGLDGDFKALFASVLKELTRRGTCIIMVSHDVEFCAAYADRCALFFDGSIVSQDAPQPFFAGKRFYTTAANRMARHLLPNAVTAEEVILSCGGNLPPREPDLPEVLPDIRPPQDRRPQKLPLWRKLVGTVSGIAALITLIYTSAALDLSTLYSGSGFVKQYGWIYGAMFLSLGIFAAALSRRPSYREQKLLKGRLPLRTKVCLTCSLLAIPLTIYGGLTFFGGKRYMLTSLLIVAETMLPFFLTFEGRKPQARELVILSVLSALAIGGRAVFFALPGFKPVAAMVILTGVAFGGEAGFMVGAMTMLCSNVLFGQGPWTPWQMFAMGTMGLLSGILFRKGLLHRDRTILSVFGFLVTLVIYGGIMNPASVLMYQPNVNRQMILTALITGVPADAVHALSTAFFLWFLSEPMLEKLDRVKVKYGLLEQKTSLHTESNP